MRNVEYLGDGDPLERMYYCSPGVVHCESYGGMDYTLCGTSMDGDIGTVGSYRYVNKKINCPDCLALIFFCKKIPNKALDSGPEKKGKIR